MTQSGEILNYGRGKTKRQHRWIAPVLAGFSFLLLMLLIALILVVYTAYRMPRSEPGWHAWDWALGLTFTLVVFGVGCLTAAPLAIILGFFVLGIKRRQGGHRVAGTIALFSIICSTVLVLGSLLCISYIVNTRMPP